jgi:hypothetical protein
MLLGSHLDIIYITSIDGVELSIFDISESRMLYSLKKQKGASETLAPKS